MKFSYHLFIAAIAATTTSSTFLFGTANAAEQNLRATASSGNSNVKEGNRNLLLDIPEIPDIISNIPSSVLDDFIDSSTLVGDITNYNVQIIDDNTFTIDGEQLDISQFQQINVRNDQPLSASRIFQASVSDGEVIVRMNHSANIEQVTKINSTTGTRFHLERLGDGDIFIEYSSTNIDQDRLTGMLLDAVPPPPPLPTRHLTAAKNKVEGKPNHHRHLQVECDDPTAIRVAVRYSSSVCQDLGSDRLDTEAYLEQIFAIINVSFEVAGLCQQLEICTLEGACDDGSNSQFDTIADLESICGEDGDNVLDSFVNEVIDGNFVNGNVCDIAQFVFGSIDAEETVSGVVGCANSFSLCDAAAGGVSNVDFSSNTDLRATLIAQSIGSSLGADPNGATLTAFVSAGTANQIENFVESRVSPTCTD